MHDRDIVTRVDDSVARVIANEPVVLRRARGYVPRAIAAVSTYAASSGTTADGAQVATIGSPPAAFAAPVTFGRDPNDLTNARGLLPKVR